METYEIPARIMVGLCGIAEAWRLWSLCCSLGIIRVIG